MNPDPAMRTSGTDTRHLFPRESKNANVYRRVRCVLACVAMLASVAVAFATQPPPPTNASDEAMEAPDLSSGLEQLLKADYLTDDERRDLRVRHGLWTDADLDTPERRALAAIVDARWYAPALLADGAGPVLLRAHAAIERGEIDAALKLLDAAPPELVQSPTGAWLKALAQSEQGRNDEAIATASALFARLQTQRDAELPNAELASAIRAADLLLRLRGPGEKDARAKGGGEGADANAAGNAGRGASDAALVAGNFQMFMTALGTARGRDRLDWQVRLLEAELLLSRDNPQQAQEALTEVLSLNPRCARAWELFGRMSVNSFNFEITHKIARRLDLLASDAVAGSEGSGGSGGADAPTTPDQAPRLVVSAAGARLRARAALRQINGEEALRELCGPSLDPSKPVSGDLQTQALVAAAVATSFEFEKAQQLLDALDVAAGAPQVVVNASDGTGKPDAGEQARPGPIVGYFEVGAALAEARQYAESARFLKEAQRRRPMDPEAAGERGLMELQAGRDDEALAALETAHRLDPFNVRVDNSLRLARELASYAQVQSEHFTVRYRPGSDSVLAEEMLPALEELFRVVTGLGPVAGDDMGASARKPAGGIDFRPPGVNNSGRTLIDLMPNHEWFGVRIAGMPKIHTIAASTGPVIAMESPREGPGHTGVYDWIRTVRHEFVHTVSLARTKNRIPLWFTEAAAQYLELGPREYQTCKLLAAALDGDALFDFEEINISFVRPKRPSDRAQGYAQGLWMYEFMLEKFGPEAPRRLMDEYARGVREDQAYRNVLGIGRDDFAAAFKPWARAQAQAWGLILPDGTPTVSELLMREALSAADKNPDDADAAKKDDRDKGDQNATPGRDGQDAEDEGAEADAERRANRGGPEVTPELVARLLEKHPTHPDLLELAMNLAIQPDEGRATPKTAPLIERYARARPVDDKPHRLLALMYLEGRAGDADAKGLENAAGDVPVSAEASREAQTRRAIEHLEFVDQREQYTPTYAMELARRYAQLKDWPRAIARAERAVSIAPFDPRPRELAATIAIQAGGSELARAERQIAALTRLEPDRDIHKRRLEAIRKKIAESK